MPPPSVIQKIEKPTWTERLTGRLFFPLVAVIIIGSGIAFFTVFWSTWRATQSGEGNYNTAEADLQLAQSIRTRDIAKSHAAELDRLPKNDVARMTVALPNEPAATELLVELEALSVESGMINPTFSVSAAPVTESPATARQSGALPDRVATLSGSFHFIAPNYDLMKQIVKAVENNLRILDLGSLKYDAETQSVDLTFTAYYLQ